MANLFKRFRDNGFRLRLTPKPNNVNNVVSPTEDLTYKQVNAEDITSSALLDTQSIHEFCTISTNRHNKYVGFEEMLEDPIIAAAVEMYADDATQYNEQGNIIWAEGDNEDAVKAANRLINVLDLNEKAWRHIYSLCVYGDLYLRLYKEGDVSDYATIYSNDVNTMSVSIKPEDKSRHLEEYIEYVENPACLFDLQVKDKTAGFIRVIDTSNIKSSSIFDSMPMQTVNSGNTISYDRMSFVHITLSESVERNPELLKVSDDDDEGTVYKVKSGKSILADAYHVTQSLKLLEDSLLLNRLTKSAIIRLLQVEVGDIPRTDVNNLLHRLKNNLEQKMSTDVNSGATKSFNSPGPLDNIVYMPTKNGKGAITVQNLGGDVNVKDIVDLDYFNNKKLAALKIPKQFLNFDSPEGIGGNGQSLTKVSSRYAHTIMRIQNAYLQGITNLLNYFFLDKDQDYIGKFTLKMVSPATVEDTERSEQLSNNIQQIGDILSLVGDLPDEKRLAILKELINTKLNMPNIASYVQDYIDELETNNDNNEDNSEDNIGDLGADDFEEDDLLSNPSPNNLDKTDFSTDTDFDISSADNVSNEPIGDLGMSEPTSSIETEPNSTSNV